jgi:hypothetical protein
MGAVQAAVIDKRETLPPAAKTMWDLLSLGAAIRTVANSSRLPEAWSGPLRGSDPASVGGALRAQQD